MHACDSRLRRLQRTHVQARSRRSCNAAFVVWSVALCLASLLPLAGWVAYRALAPETFNCYVNALASDSPLGASMRDAYAAHAPDHPWLAAARAVAASEEGRAGAPLSERSVLDVSSLPSQVYLYRRPILDEWAERGDVTLGELIAHVLVHEIGHHFGLSDDDIHAAEED